MNSNFPAWWLYPVAGPRLLLGLFSICLSKAYRGPILQDQRANGENTLNKKMMRERVSCADREAASRKALSWRGDCLPRILETSHG